MKQRTISQQVEISGFGLHTGHPVTMVLKPSAVNTGIVFIRTDLPQAPSIKLGKMDIIFGGDAGRYSALRNGEAIIYTIEHFLSALASLYIDNIIVEINNDEPPALDGSSQGFLHALKKAGVVLFEAEQDVFIVQEPIMVEHRGATVSIEPCHDFKISYTLEYAHPLLKQFFEIIVTPDDYEKQLAPCRTFCLLEEAEAIRKANLGLGANYQNTTVYGPEGVIENTLRFPDESARHKTMDLVGDLYLLGFAIKGHVKAYKSGHALNRELLRKILEQKENKEKNMSDIKLPMEVTDIMKIIPHRFPFLLVDRIIELDPGKRVVGIKNMTMNEQFFQGHFPGKPVMPGVLMLEAMAQVGAVGMLLKPELQGKIGFYMSIDEVKFRKMIIPGDQIVMEVDIVRLKGRIAQAKGVCKVDGKVACEALMSFAFGE